MWDQNYWNVSFKAAEIAENWSLCRELRRIVFEDTHKISMNRNYVLADGKPVVVSPAEPSVIFKKKIELDPLEDHHRFNTAIRVVSEDCLALAKRLSEKGEKPLVLNMASDTTPGGGVKNGAGAQEEYLFRATNYCTTMYTPHVKVSYPLYGDSCGIYSPNVIVFRGTEAEGYPLLETPFAISIVAVPALKNPVVVGDGYLPPDEERMRERIRTIFRIAGQHNHDCLILSAFGCGAYHNPPRAVARFFWDILQEDEFRGRFSDVWFAIKKDHNDKKGNFAEFEHALTIEHMPF